MKVQVSLDPIRSELVLDFEYSEQIKAMIKTIYGRRFDYETKTWRVPLAALEDLINTLGCRLEFKTPYREVVQTMNQVPPIMGEIDLGVLDLMRIKPYGYQLIGGTAFLPVVKGGILADVPGLGKTLQTFLGFAHLYMKGEATRCLVFCKKALKSQWLYELERFTPFRGIKIYGDAAKREKLYEEAMKPEYNFIFVNYEFLQHDAMYVKQQDKKGHNGFQDFWYLSQIARTCQIIALDEAQKIKNNSKIHRNMIRMTFPTTKKDVFEPPEYRWALTGTPFENSPQDLFNICKFVNPFIFGQNPGPFNSRYYTDRYHTKVNHQKLDDLKMRIAPYMLRRTQESVKGDFPEIFPPEFIRLDMEDDQELIHSALRNDLKKHLDEGDEEFAIGSFALLLQVADYPKLLESSESETGRKLYHKMANKNATNPKIEWICDYLNARSYFYPNAKTLIFTRSDRMALFLKEALTEVYREEEILIYCGKLNDAQRDEIKSQFWGPAKVMIATDAGSEGLNLQCADLLINVDLPYNPARLDQRIGRIRRKGSEFSHVRIISLISKDSIDERILDIIYEKQHLIDQVIEGNVANIELSRNLLKELLESDDQK